MDKEKTKVIFRCFRDGSIIAMFPEIAVDTIGYNCQSYMHVGQHGAASPNIIQDTKPAKPDEYKNLYEELTEIGYNLDIIKRFRYSHQQKRMDMYN